MKSFIYKKNGKIPWKKKRKKGILVGKAIIDSQIKKTISNGYHMACVNNKASVIEEKE